MDAPKILVFAGSIRSGSLNEKLAVAAVAAIRRAGGDPTHISLKDFALPLYNGDDQARDGVPEAALKLASLFFEHRGVFIASPEYNASFTPLLKNTLDWLSRHNVEGRPPLPAFKERAFALGSATNGAMGGYRGLTQLRSMMELGLGALVLPEIVAVGGAATAFGPDGGLAKEKISALLDAVSSRLVAFARNMP